MAPVSAAAAGIAAGFAAATEGTKEYREDMAKLETNAALAGASLGLTKDALKDLNAITGESDSNVEALSNLLQAGFTDNEMQRAVDALSGAVISFPDTLKIESLADSLQETLATGQATGQFGELLDRLGINTEHWNKSLERASKNGTAHELVLTTLANRGLAQVNEQYRQTHQNLVENSDAQFELNEAMAELGAAAEPVVAELTGVLADLLGMFAEWIGGMDEGTLQLVAGFVLVLAAIAPILTTVGSLMTGLGAIIPLFAGAGTAAAGAAAGTGALGGALALLTSPVTLVIAAIGLLVAGFVYLWNNCEEFRQFWIDLWEKLKAAPMQFAIWVLDVVQSVVDKFNEIDAFLGSVFATDWTEHFGAFGEVLNGFFATCQSVWDGIKEVFDGVIQFVVGTFTGDWSSAWEGVKQIFKGVFDALGGIAKAPINAVIGFLNMAISGLNTLIAGLNKIQFNVPDWVPMIGGKHFGFDIPDIPKIPTLAKGGTIAEGQAIVAEAGPELIRMRGGKTTVTPLTAAARNAAVGHGGNTVYEYHTYNITGNVKDWKDLETLQQICQRERNRRQDLQMGVSKRRFY